MNHIIDWLVAAQKNDAPFLKDTLNGKPKLLLHIKSVDEAYAEADKDSATLRKKFAQASDDGSIHVMDLKDGMRIVEVATREARQREGSLMVGDGGYEGNIAEKKFKLKEDACYTHLLQDEHGDIYSIFRLPKGFRTEGNISLSYCTALTTLPKECPSRTKVYMPDGAKVLPQEWPKARAAWMKAHGLKDKPARPARAKAAGL